MWKERKIFICQKHTKMTCSEETMFMLEIYFELEFLEYEIRR
jgi:hypothetical protein